MSHQYLSPLAMRDFSREFRAISHAQIELLAAQAPYRMIRQPA